MKSIKISLSTFLLLCLSLTSCDIDDGSSSNNNQQQEIPNSFSEYFGNDISRDFLGTVVDKNHLPISGVTITIGSETALTDNNGVFIIRDADVNKRFGYVKAEKAGYIHASRSVVPSEGTNKVTIMMLDANITGTVNSGSAGTVSLNNGSSVSFDGNFIKEDGSAYSGSVDVIMHHLDPTDDDMSQQMPGMLYAQNEEGAERMLQTLGMLAVELRGSGGEDLNLAEGSTSEIKIPVDASLMSIAPATIPLWYFDEVNGFWKEEGQATLQGNMYVGSVSHFSFWNCDIPAEAITLCVTVTDENGNELSNIEVNITSATFGSTNGSTNENGEVCGFVPSNESLDLSIFNYGICGNTPLHLETIGSFSSDSNITIIITDNPYIIEETVTGKLNNCDGASVTDGYVQITYGETTFTDSINDDGSFEIIVLRCLEDNTFSIMGTNFNNPQTTGEIYYTFTSPFTNLGDLNACNTIDEFFTYSIDDSAVERLYIENDDLGTGTFSDYIQLHGGPFNTTFNSIIINVPNQLGSYTIGVDDFVKLVLGFEENGTNQLYVLSNTEDCNITINVSKAAEFIGDHIDINFSGELIHVYEGVTYGPTRTIVGSAHIKKR
ncbi:hypothetical protein [uncultured Winogradskyella sp.]|uniref:hypothetical protein n=1 Tax=uncultured Winogradskyella sp. TaxID=395353 RepID=UPI00261BB20A|nr:hypothetical protein [uncultured Winogradskyella sp.]|tara:strand:+ start:8624 stop:10444 length:1821 start_codon:yes stop_codon:yes gene_type:complete